MPRDISCDCVLSLVELIKTKWRLKDAEREGSRGRYADAIEDALWAAGQAQRACGVYLAKEVEHLRRAIGDVRRGVFPSYEAEEGIEDVIDRVIRRVEDICRG